MCCFCRSDNERPSALALLLAIAAHYQLLVVSFPCVARQLASEASVLVFGDVLQGYCDAQQTALEQLIMLSNCVEDADAADPNLQDHLAYIAFSNRGSGSGSSSDSEEDQDVSSWEQGLSPSELAAIPADLLLFAHLETLHQQET
jgi:hypothetical protein